MTNEIRYRRHGRWIQLQPPGGILSPETLAEIAAFANRYAVRSVHPGAFQDLWLRFSILAHSREACMHLGRNHRFRESKGRDGVFLCSAASVEYEKATPWATESVYLDLIDACTPIERSFSVSICDPLQSLTPLRSCYVNLLASPIHHHWSLIVMDKERRTIQAPFLIPTFQIPAIIQELNNHERLSVDIFEILRSKFPDSLLYGPDPTMIASPDQIAPYEGFCTAENSDRHCLGILRIQSGFRPIFLDELAYFSRKHRVGRIFLTSLHSLFIKNIAVDTIEDWKKLLGRHGLNLRHDDVSLNWQVEQGFEKMRSHIIEMLRASEAAGGLSIAVGQMAMQQDKAIAIVPARSFLFQKAYRVYHRHDFLRHGSTWYGNGERMTEVQAGQYIKELYQIYWNLFTRPSVGIAATREVESEPVLTPPSFSGQCYECTECMTVYEPERGDSRSDIAPGTPFENLPGDYVCSVCGSPSFKQIESSGYPFRETTRKSLALTAGFD